MGSVRKSAVAGQFYPGDAVRLEKEVDACLLGVSKGEQPLAGFVPHAGYLYSGKCAGVFYGSLSHVPPLVVLLGPNHTGLGSSIAISGHSGWETPLGDIPVDQERAFALHSELGGIGSIDDLAHLREHSLEVHLPFLMRLRPDVTILPVTLSFLTFEIIERFAHALQVVTGDLSSSGVLLIASTDMSHFVSARKAHELDHMALEHALAMDPHGLYNTVREKNISMCGIIPSTAALCWAMERNASACRLLSYTNSGEVSGDLDSVVAYASLGIYL